MSFLMDDLAKTADEALNEARKVSWDRWANSEPLITGHVDEQGKAYLFFISEMVKGKVVLLHIWDYTLLPCRRSLSYIQEWHKRYSSAGLVTIGVHSPVFDFAKDKKNILDAIRDLNITYPVVQDNGFEIWRSVENRFWPRTILFDSTGKTREDHVGEGYYLETEHTIQELLRKLSPGLACPPLMKPVRTSDEPDYKPKDSTPEIFLGLRHKSPLGNLQTAKTANEEIHFQDTSGGTYAPGVPYLSGSWVTTHESIHGGATYKGTLQFIVNFVGTDAYIVARSRAKNPADIPQAIRPNILLDGKQILEDRQGRDASMNEYRRSIVTIRDPKLHHIASKLDAKPHTLSISMQTDGPETLELYGVFFEDRR